MAGAPSNSLTKNQLRARIGYLPYGSSMTAPGDRRRFAGYAEKRNLSFEIADPARKYDVVILSERADLSVWSRYTGGKVVYDLIDSYLAIPRTSFKGRMRGFAKFLSRQSRRLQWDHWNAIGGMCRRADAVICSTEEQGRDIGQFCSNVHTILDMHSSVVRTIKTDYSVGRPFKLVWEGLPQTLCSLELIAPALRELRRRHDLQLNLVTDLEYYRYLGRYGKTETRQAAQRLFSEVRLHEWKEDVCSRVICSCDLAVIPLAAGDPFAFGKPENKLLLFWRMGMPAVTSATPAYDRAMRGAGLDLTCAHAGDWLAVLERFILDETARREAGTRGKAYVEGEFSEEKLLGCWDNVFASLGLDFGVHGVPLRR